MLSGTEWTEPGQGDRWPMFRRALQDMDLYPMAGADSERIAWGVAYDAIPSRAPKLYRKTNLLLTGHPLTVEDLRRIAEAK